MKPNKFEKLIGSALLSGYFPFASGTAASVVALAFLPLGNTIVALLIVLFFVYGIYIGTKFEAEYGHDPSQFTLDEFVGTWIAFFAIPLNLYSIIFIFIVWRFFDILKPFPIRNAEKLKGGLGIMSDDVIGGIFTNIVANIALFLITK